MTDDETHDLFATRREGWQFAQRLARRIRHGVASADFCGPLLADYLGLSPRQVTDRLEGVEPLTVVDLYRLAVLFNVRPSVLLVDAEEASWPVTSK